MNNELVFIHRSCLITIVRDFDQIAVGVAEVDRNHGAERACSRRWPFDDLDAEMRDVRDDISDRNAGTEAQIA